jgi:phosphatidylinositol alpha-mannosyltransferase
MNPPAASKPLTIWYVLDDGLDSTDGIQQYILALGAYMESQGHRVFFVVGQTAAQGPNIKSMARNVRVTFNGNRMSMPVYASARGIARLMAEAPPDVVHVQMLYSPFLSGRIIRRLADSCALIGTFHIIPYSPLAGHGARALGFLQRGSLARFDAVCSVTKPAQQFLLRAFGVHSIILPNVVDVGRFAKAEPLKKYSDDRATILFLGRLVARKGAMELLQAIDELLALGDVPPFRLVICGRGPLESKLREFCRRRGLESYVEFTGFIEESDKPRYVASADIAVFPSLGGESFGIVLIEAMAGGRAIVLGGDNPGYAQVLRSEQLVNPRRPEAFAALLKKYLTDKSAGSAARSWQAQSVGQYEVAHVGNKMLAVYQKALAGRRAGNV